jgi:hypothetical protein
MRFFVANAFFLLEPELETFADLGDRIDPIDEQRCISRFTIEGTETRISGC